MVAKKEREKERKKAHVTEFGFWFGSLGEDVRKQLFALVKK